MMVLSGIWVPLSIMARDAAVIADVYLGQHHTIYDDAMGFDAGRHKR